MKKILSLTIFISGLLFLSGIIDYQTALGSYDYTLKPVYRIWSDEKQTHFYTASQEEKEYVCDCDIYPKTVWKYERIAYNAYTRSGSYSYGDPDPYYGILFPVYRFWSNTKQGHFYTISKTERDYVSSNYSEEVWKYEDVAYYAYSSEQAGTNPVYRFWSDTKQHHFFTSSETERDYIIANYDSEVWNYEGIAWYVPE